MALGLLGALSLLVSAMPPALAWPGAALVLSAGAQCAHREWRRPAARLEWAGGSAAACWRQGAQASRLQSPQVRFRGGMAVLSGRDGSGHLRRFVWWPDTLPAAARRQLRLAAQSGQRNPQRLPALAA